jgi:hypothetical protein
MRMFALFALLLLAACATEVSVSPDAGGSGDTAADTAADIAADTAGDTAADTAADTTAGDTGSDTGALCPAEPFSTEACDQEGTQCTYGSECCCGTCYPSSFCTCSGGRWACGSSDACMRPSCAGSACATDADCIGGAPSLPLTCTAGLCTAPPSQGGCYGLAQPDCASHNAEACVWLDGCATDPSPGEGGPAGWNDPGDPGCHPVAACTSNADCPSDSSVANWICVEVDYICGGMNRNICVQQGGG